jgi:hypothetical protein
MTTVVGKMPRDSDSAPMQVAVGSTNRANLTAGVASSSGTVPTGTVSLVIVRCTDYFWLAFGVGSATATANSASALVAPGEGVYPVPAGTTHFAGLRVGSTDVVVQLESLSTV